MHVDGRSNVYCTRNKERIHLLEATGTDLASASNVLAPAVPPFNAMKNLLSAVETSGGVDGSEVNRPARLLVVQLPALAAVFRALFGVVCTAETWEVGEIFDV